MQLGWPEWLSVPEDPFCEERGPLYFPEAMRSPPLLPAACGSILQEKSALLVNPFYRKDPHASFGKHVLTPTLALTSIAATTPPHWNVAYWDENLLQGPPPCEPVPAAVGITVHLTFAQRAYELSRWYRKMGAKTILGGPHVIACPDKAAPHADALGIGDGVQIWPEFLRDVEQGKIAPQYSAGFGHSYDLDPHPRRDLVPKGFFLTTASVIATRGCRNRCSFCYLATEGLHVPRRERDPEDICRQIIATGEPFAVFVDNNLGANPHYLMGLCRALKKLGILWTGAVTLDVTDDPHLVNAMADAGCTGVFIGFETLTDENLDWVGKRGPRSRDFARRVRMLHDAGIHVNGSFVLGFDGDQKDVFERTAHWIEAQKIECATFHIMTPYPGTPLFRKMEQEGRLLHKNWDLYDTAHAVFRPAHMTPEELERGYDWLYRRTFSPASIWRRRPEALSAVPPYLMMALLYKRSNRIWHWLIRNRLVSTVWRPFIRWSGVRRRNWKVVPAGV